MKTLVVAVHTFQEGEFRQWLEKVEELETLYQTIEVTGGQGTLNDLRMIHSTMINKWSKFEMDFKRYVTMLELSLKFQLVVFAVSVCACVFVVCCTT